MLRRPGPGGCAGACGQDGPDVRGPEPLNATPEPMPRRAPRCRARPQRQQHVQLGGQPVSPIAAAPTMNASTAGPSARNSARSRFRARTTGRRGLVRRSGRPGRTPPRRGERMVGDDFTGGFGDQQPAHRSAPSARCCRSAGSAPSTGGRGPHTGQPVHLPVTAAGRSPTAATATDATPLARSQTVCPGPRRSPSGPRRHLHAPLGGGRVGVVHARRRPWIPDWVSSGTTRSRCA